MRQRPLFTVSLCRRHDRLRRLPQRPGRAGSARGRRWSRSTRPTPPSSPSAARAAVQVEMPAGVELKLWAPDGLIADPVALDVTPDGTVYVAGTQRNNLPLDIRGHQDWMTTAHTMKTVEDLRRFYRRRDVAGQQREERLDPRRQRRRHQGHPRPRRVQGARLPRPGHRRRRHRRQVADRLRGLQRRPDLGHDRRRPVRRQGPDRRRAARRLPPARRQGRRPLQPAQHHRRGHEHPSGLRRPRRLRRADGPGRAPLLGGRRHRPPRHRPRRQDLVVPEPGRGDALRSGRLQLRGVRARASATCRSSRSTSAAT